MANDYMYLSLKPQSDRWLPRKIGSTSVYVLKTNVRRSVAWRSQAPIVRIKCINHKESSSLEPNGFIYVDDRLTLTEVEKSVALYSSYFWSEQAKTYQRQKTLHLLGVSCA